MTSVSNWNWRNELFNSQFAKHFQGIYKYNLVWNMQGIVSIIKWSQTGGIRTLVNSVTYTQLTELCVCDLGNDFFGCIAAFFLRFDSESFNSVISRCFLFVILTCAVQ